MSFFVVFRKDKVFHQTDNADRCKEEQKKKDLLQELLRWSGKASYRLVNDERIIITFIYTFRESKIKRKVVGEKPGKDYLNFQFLIPRSQEKIKKKVVVICLVENF